MATSCNWWHDVSLDLERWMTHTESVMATITHGGCACGAVRYQVEGQPSNSMICHCQTCRRVSAAPVVAWVTFDMASFAIVKGQPAEYSSTAPVRRRFCSFCGTQLTYQHINHPTTIDITTCSLEEPSLFPPTHHSWLSHDIAWVRFGDGLPIYQEWRR